MDLLDIPAATQIFTPKWMVRYLVENTHGRLLLRVHPDSSLRGNMKYYVPNDNDRHRDFYNRYMRGEIKQHITGWVNESDFEAELVE